MKKSGQFLFTSKLKWTCDSKGIITANGIPGELEVATPKVSKGLPYEAWSPEHLLISAVSSCFMTTCLFYAKQNKLSLSSFECEAIGQVELKYGKLRFTAINIYPVIGIEKKAFEEKAAEVIELTKQNCLVSKTLSVIIYYHPKIEIITPTSETKKQTRNNKREIFF